MENFIARAGSIIDRAHRVTGFFMVLSFVFGAGLLLMARDNARLSSQIDELAQRMPVFVVPGSQAGVYSPSRSDMLMLDFMEFVAQSLNTYNAQSLEGQYKEVSKFFTERMQQEASTYFQNKIFTATQDGQASMMVIDRDSVVIKPTDPPYAGVKGKDYYLVSFKALRQSMIGLKVVSAEKLQINLVMERKYVSKDNPWGFLLARYEEKKVEDGPAPVKTPPAK